MIKYVLQILIWTSLVQISCTRQEQNAADSPYFIEFNRKATEFISAQNFDSALHYLDRAIEVDSTNYLVYGNKCSILCSQKNFKGALLATQKQIELKPDLAEAWTFAGILSDKLEDTATAIRYYKKCIELFDERIGNPEMRQFSEANKMNRAVSLILIGREEIGRNELRKLREAHPEFKFSDNLLILSKEEYIDQLLSN